MSLRARATELVSSALPRRRRSGSGDPAPESLESLESLRTRREMRSCAGPTPRLRAQWLAEARRDPKVVLGDELTGAAKSNNAVLVQSLLDRQANPNHINHLLEPRVPLGCTSDAGVVEVLVKHPGTDVNATDCLNDRTVLEGMLLHHRDQPDLVQALFTHPDLDVHKGTALSTGARFASPELLRVLLQHPSVDVNDGRAGFLHHAFARTDERAVEVARILLECPQLDINARLTEGRMPNSEGATPLHFLSQRDSLTVEVGEREADKLRAAAARQVEMLKLLLARPELEANLQDSRGATALHSAATAGRQDIVSDLLADGRCEASMWLRDADGRTPLDCAVLEQEKERPRWERLPCTANHAEVVRALSAAARASEAGSAGAPAPA